MNIGKRIKTKRELLGISQTELAQKINVSKQTLYKYENGIVTNIPSDKIELLAQKLNTTPAYLMGWEDNLTNENADFTVELLTKTELLEITKKIDKLTDENKKTVYNMVEFLYEKEGH